jgi:hypothetical protein
MSFTRLRGAYLAVIAMVFLLAGMAFLKVRNGDAEPKLAIPVLLRAFDRYSIVALGESHWSRQAGEFYLSLIRTPGFSDHVNTVVLECGNSRYQAILDRYMDGKDVPFEQLSQVWRNTTKVVSWESPIYQHLITGLRDVNRGLPASSRIRVLAGDAPIDWSRVKNHDDWESALAGEDFFATLIEREVLAQNRKALLIMGANHVTHGRNWFGTDDVTSLLEKDGHPVFVAMLWGIPGVNDQAVTSSPAPSLTLLRDTRLGNTPYFGRHAEQAADAYLYLGRSEDVNFPDWPALQADKAYWAELQRRHQIEFGCPLDIARWNRREKPCP